MRSYVVDQLQEPDIERIAAHLEKAGLDRSLDTIYWLPVPAALLTDEQKEHGEECGPHCFSIELSDLEGFLALELLVRARNRMRCSCVMYATQEQRAYAIDFVDEMLKNLDIPA